MRWGDADAERQRGGSVLLKTTPIVVLHRNTGQVRRFHLRETEDRIGEQAGPKQDTRQDGLQAKIEF